MKILKTPILAACAGFAGLALAAPCFFTRTDTFSAVARGTAARAGIDDASLADQAAAIAFRLGGWTAADGARALLVFLPVFFILLAAAILSARLPARFSSIVRAGLLITAFVLTVLGGLNSANCWSRDATQNIRLLAPVDLFDLAAKSGRPVFYNPAAANLIAAHAPGLLDPAISQAERANLVQSPVAFRAKDKATPFAAVLLCGNLSESRALIDMLLASPNWHLELADHHGLLFRRGGGPAFRPLPVESVPFSEPHEKALCLARTALSFEIAGLKTEARDYMTAATALDSSAPDVLIASSALFASQGRWLKARTMAERALKRWPDSAQAAYLNARAMLELGAVEKAYQQSSRLVRRNPRDISALLLHARAARAVHNPEAEIRSLEKLLAIAGAGGVPAGRIRIYLGQAWSQRGFPEQALENYRAALAGELLPEEEKDVREAIQTIERNRLPSSQS